MENDFVLHSRPAGKPNIVAIARHIHKNHRLLFLANIKRWLVYDAPQWKPVLKPTILKVIASELQCLAEENGNETLASLPVRALTEDRRQKLRVILNKYQSANLRTAVSNAMQSDFLNGRTKRRKAAADFDWIMEEKHFVQCMENSL